MTQPYRLDAPGQDTLRSADTVAAEVIRANAMETDRQARFPRENVEALRKAGILGIVGKGLGMPGGRVGLEGLRPALTIAPVCRPARAWK